jgi:hypothetical protein
LPRPLHGLGRYAAIIPFVKTFALAAAAALAVAVAAPAGTGVASAYAEPSCTGRARTTLHLTEADNGHRVCARRGAHIDVVLRVDPDASPEPSTWWSAVTVDGRAVVVDTKHPRVLPVRGATLGYFLAVHRGSARLSSTRTVCPAQPSPPCHLLQAWSVRIVVR